MKVLSTKTVALQEALRGSQTRKTLHLEVCDWEKISVRM
jgi:hypothetical protein